MLGLLVAGLLALVVLLLHMRSRSRLQSAAGDGFVLLQRLQVAPRQWLLLIEYQGRHILAGVGEGGVSVLERDAAAGGKL